MSATPPLPRIGIALGGGAARGWAHIGVLSALREHGIEPEVVCGTSIGALVGGIYAGGKLDELEQWVRSLTRRDILSLVDLTVGSGGVIGGRRLMDLFRSHLGDVAIENLPRGYAAVATDLGSGAEVWIREGPLLDAMRASIALPGVFTPVHRNGRWLVDGGLVNPIPSNVCRALGAELVIAVDLHGASKHSYADDPEGQTQPAVVRSAKRDEKPGMIAGRAEASGAPADTDKPPAFTWIVQTALDIMQIRIGRSRLAGDPPDVLLRPRVLQVQPLDFAGGGETIEEGRRAVRRMLPALTDLIEPRPVG